MTHFNNIPQKVLILHLSFQLSKELAKAFIEASLQLKSNADILELCNGLKNGTIIP